MTKVKNVTPMAYYGQYAPSQSERREYVPGKAHVKPNEMNWEREYRPAVAGRGEMRFERTFVIGRNAISDIEIKEPIIIGEKQIDNDWIV